MNQFLLCRRHARLLDHVAKLRPIPFVGAGHVIAQRKIAVANPDERLDLPLG